MENNHHSPTEQNPSVFKGESVKENFQSALEENTPTPQQLQELVAALSESLYVPLGNLYLSDTDIGREYEALSESFDKAKKELLQLLDNNNLSAEDKIYLIRNFYFRMIADGIMSPLETASGQLALRTLEERDIKESRDIHLSIMRGQGISEEKILDILQQKDEEFRIRARERALKGMERTGLNFALEGLRQQKADNVKKAFNAFLQENEIKNSVAVREIMLNEENQITNQSQLETDFADGNFLFHSTGVDKALQILQSGFLVNSLALRKQGKALNGATNNSGIEGISWSLNQISAMPGDRYHLVGFVSNIDSILANDMQLTVPSRAAPYEVIQVGKDLSAQDFYAYKNQLELYEDFGFGDKNSVLSNLIFLRSEADNQGDKATIFPSMILEKLKSEPEFFLQEENLDQYYSFEGDSILLSEDLLQQTEIPTGLVFLRALIKSGQLQALHRFSGVENLSQAVEVLRNKEAYDDFMNVFNKQIKKNSQEMNKFDGQIKPLAQPVSEMFFVVPDHDLSSWKEILSRCAQQPKGLLIYDGQKVRLENFASRHSGDHNQLTQILRQAIPAKSEAEGGLSYGQYFLQKDMATTGRTGHRLHVLREKDTQNRQTLTKEKWLDYKKSLANDT